MARTLSDQLHDLAGDVDSLELELASAQDRIEGLEDQVADLEAMLAAAEETIEDIAPEPG